MNVINILADLVSIDSRSAISNVPIIARAAERAERAGLCARLLPFTDANGVKKSQMIAVAPRKTKDSELIELALVGHTDTVPYDPAWTEALTLTQHEGKLFGRGACDTKGFIASAFAAIEKTDLSKLKRPLALVLTADEEIGCLGAKRLADDRAFSVRNAIVGEPTSLRPMRAGKGYCLADVVVRGREGHSAYPAMGASAIMRAAALVNRIESIGEDLKLLPAHNAFDPPFTTINVGTIQGGTAKNIIAGECRFTLEWRPVPGQAPETVPDLVRREIDEICRGYPEISVEFNVTRLDAGIETGESATLVRALEEATKTSAGTISFGTEAPQMAQLGAEAVVFGPGDIRVAHRTGEFVPTEELERAVEILRQMIERFCAT